MKNFITNSGAENLEKRLSELIINSEELKFLVGFFYFSGLKELYDSLLKNQNVSLKVLVGLNVDKLNEEIIEFADFEDRKGSCSNEEIFNKFLLSLKKSINTDKFDNKEFYEQVKFFVELLQNGNLKIRKTIRPNHSKLYIFKLNNLQVGRKTLFITGSSNLTGSGLLTQEEFNIEVSDYGFKEAEEYFDELWEKSVPITEDNAKKERIIKILEKETLIKEITPFEAYLLVLKFYLDSFEKKDIEKSIVRIMEKNNYTPYKYQLDAIQQAISVIEKNNGVILADVVGLGKSVIASLIARELNKRGVIICPPSLMGDSRLKNTGWYMYKEQFELHDWDVWSIGDIEKLEKFLKDKNDIEIVIIDEAHRFRNQDTKGYESLKNICRGRKVILLTATPFNNRPEDILSLLKLFIIPKKSSITLENNLVDRFRKFKSIFDGLALIKKNYRSNDEKKRKKAFDTFKNLFGKEFTGEESLKDVKKRAEYLSKQIRDVIEPVVIRRNRLDLQHNPLYKDEIKHLSKVADPREWFYELTKEQSEFYDSIVQYYFADPDDGGKFKGAIYRPFEYEKGESEIKKLEKLSEKENFEYNQQKNLCDFMRRLLVKRFESSFGSFEQSLKNFKETTETVKSFIDKTGKYILDRDLLERIYEMDIEEIEERLKEYAETMKRENYPKYYKVYDINKFQDKDKFLKDIENDLKIFDEILSKLKKLKLTENYDPKTSCLIENLKEQLKKDKKRKIVIFSEYVDTVKYLQPALEKVFKGRVLSVPGVLNQRKEHEIYSNFDASFVDQKDDYDILLTSDKLSEGFNLNRAGMIINYDIPWNPVRVIQRIGRINRISKKVFDELYIVNFFPTETGADIVQSREIASHKMFLIHNTLGEDSKIFDIDETPKPSKLYDKINQNPENIEYESFYTKILKEFYEIKSKYPELIESLKDFPTRVKVAKKAKEDELIVVIKKGRLFINSMKGFENPEQITFEEAFSKIKCAYDEKSVELSENFWEKYEKIKNYKETETPLPEKSNERQAIDVLKELRKSKNDQILEYHNFIKMLLEDILDYGTLSLYTLRRIANLETDDSKIKRTIEELKKLKDELGENYLEQEKRKHIEESKEVIVAIENRKFIT
ncbi:MAG: helicase-related protein [candidate division WOR-3 bacterium]